MTSASTRIRIAHVITGLGVGGAEMMLLKLVTGIDRERFESRVMALGSELALAERIRAFGVEVESANMRPSLIGGVLGMQRLRTRLDAFAPHLVQTWMYHADLTGGMAARTLGLPVIWNIQAGTLDQEGMIFRTRALARAAGVLSRIVPRRIVSCSQTTVDVHASIGYDRPKFVVIPNGTDLTLFRPDAGARKSFREEIGVSAETPLAGMMARLHPQKAHPVLFVAFAELMKTNPDVRLVLCGLGLESSNDQLVNMLTDLGIARNVILLGLRNDVPRVLAGLDVHVLSSSYGEAFPNVLGEAMASGLPCVVTDVGDSELIVGDTGITVPRRQPEALAAALRKMFDMPREALGELGLKARQRIAEKFSLEKSIAAYEALYEEIALRSA